MKQSISIRPAVVSEAELLTAVAVRSKAYWGYLPEFMEACRDELAVTMADIEQSRYLHFVAEKARIIVGYYALDILSPDHMELEAMFVEPEHIGSGVGRMLMQHAKVQAARLGASTILIQSDPHAAEFYRIIGGVRIGSKESASVPGRLLPLFEVSLNHGAA